MSTNSNLTPGGQTGSGGVVDIKNVTVIVPQTNPRSNASLSFLKCVYCTYGMMDLHQRPSCTAMAASAGPVNPVISSDQSDTDVQYIHDPSELLMHVDPPSGSENTATERRGTDPNQPSCCYQMCAPPCSGICPYLPALWTCNRWLCSGARTQQNGPGTSQTLWETHTESVKNKENKYCIICSGTGSCWNGSATNRSKSGSPGNQIHNGPRFWSRVWMLMFLRNRRMETV